MSPEKPLVPDTQHLVARLRQAIQGEVRFDDGSRALYGADASNYRQLPIGVVVPKSVDDVVATVRICRELRVPILARGGGTSQCGQCVNVAVVIDASKYLNRILEIDPEKRFARVEPGVVCDQLRDAAEEHALTFGPDPGTHSRCTLGGMVGNNSCGMHSVMAGKTDENIESLEILTYDGARFWVGPTSDEEFSSIVREGGRRGEIYSKLKALIDKYADDVRSGFPQIRRRVSGYNLNHLLPENGFNVARALVGTEGTCAVTLQAKTLLVPSPQGRIMLVLGYPDIYCAADAVPQVLRFKPIAMEGLDLRIVGTLRSKGLHLENIAMLPEGGAWLMVEFGAETRELAEDQAREASRALERQSLPPTMRLLVDPAEQARVWAIREHGNWATVISDVPGEPIAVCGWEDAAVDQTRLGDYLREFQALVDSFGYKTSLYGHFGEGCIHTEITFDFRTPEGVRTFREFLKQAAVLVVRYGGSLSGEHGDGQAKAEFLPLMFGDRLMQAFREFKAIWDPNNRMNPGKVVDPYRADENLRLGPEYQPMRPATHFSFADKQGSFTRAVEHCVGTGKCRSKQVGTMCPSYRATGEERYSTRGRSRLFSEMLRGDIIRDGWKSEEVKEALELCLACKGCKSDCPTHVDMATYKAEFLSHYYEGRLRPLNAFAMGMIGSWAGLAARLPGLTNFFTQSTGLSSLAKAMGGIAQERRLPRFAARPFRQVFSARERKNVAGVSVLLWPDTFNNYFHPETALAAVEVLEHAGYRVELPTAGLCCGRPLYDSGMLDRAKRQLRKILEVLRPQIDAGMPVVVLEPACLAVFRDEMPNLFPLDETAGRLARQSFTLSEFLVKARYCPPRLAASALVHGHCHQKAVTGMGDEIRMLEKLGLDFDVLDSGCCGMSGSFGFDKHKYRVSVDIGELALLPEVRAASHDTLIVTNGYSCREQIEQCAGRKALHLAEVLQMSIQRHASARPGLHHSERAPPPVEVS